VSPSVVGGIYAALGEKHTGIALSETARMDLPLPWAF
jgi:hypothetical protein